jgi:hypothetical protein
MNLGQKRVAWRGHESGLYSGEHEGNRPGGGRAEMNGLLALLIVIALFVSCGSQQAQVNKIVENGVEVILNHTEPVRIKDEPSVLDLEEEFEINFGGPEIGDLGIADATSFDVDQHGFIYFFHSFKEGDKIFKFGTDGKFLKSWGRRGQGPGEVMFISSAFLTPHGQMIISDHSSRKLIWYTNDGKFEKQVMYPAGGQYFRLYPIADDRFVALARIVVDKNADSFDFDYVLLDEGFKELRKLDTYKYPNPLKKPERGVSHNYFFEVRSSSDAIFIANEDRGYEILKFDLQGNLLMKIRKEYSPVKVPDNVLKERKAYYEKSGRAYYLPNNYLPICDFFPDDEGRLFAMTYERGENAYENWCDIFNSTGALIGRKTMSSITLGDLTYCSIKVAKHRLYSFQESSDGYRVFKVYKVLWK